MVALQTEAFHTTPPIGLLDGMTKRFFEAEVLSGALWGSAAAACAACSVLRSF